VFRGEKNDKLWNKNYKREFVGLLYNINNNNKIIINNTIIIIIIIQYNNKQ